MSDAGELRVGVALSGGGAAGMAHIGVLEELQGAGITIGWVAGSSTGSMVGAACAAGQLAGFRDTMCGLTRRQVLRLFDPTWPHRGLLEGRRALELVRPYLGDRIETLPCPYAAVATDLDSGVEVVLREGEVFEAIRASIAVPGLFVPQQWEGRMLVDGGLANPVPVSVARELGAPFVIAVSVLSMPGDVWLSPPTEEHGMARQLLGRFMARLRHSDIADEPNGEVPAPARSESAEEAGLIAIISRAGAIVHARLAAALLESEPPDFMISVPIAKVGLFDFHRSAELVAAGRVAANRALPSLRSAINATIPLHQKVSRWLNGTAERWSQPR
jgi:NTE family protein